MANVTSTKLTNAQLSDLSALLGEPPVLSSENAENYQLMWKNLIECFRPADLMELLLVQQIQTETWKILRLHRHQALAVQRRYRESSQFLAERREVLSAKKQAFAEELARKTGQPVTEYSMLIELDNTIMSAVADVDKIVAQKPTEIEHNRAMEDGLSFQERIDRLLTSAHKRRNDAVHLLDMYRHGLGQHWREISDKVIDAEASEVSALPEKTTAAEQVGQTSAQLAQTSTQDTHTLAPDVQMSPEERENANATPAMGVTDNAAALVLRRDNT
jgi:predicted ATP-dependent protease